MTYDLLSNSGTHLFESIKKCQQFFREGHKNTTATEGPSEHETESGFGLTICLGGGFKYLFMFTLTWGNDPI